MARNLVSTAALGRRDVTVAYGFLAPSLVGVTIFLAVPIGVIVWLSFQRWDLINPARFVGFSNWSDVLSGGDVWRSLAVTAMYVVLVTPVEIVFGIVLATCLVQRLPGTSWLRVLYLVPWISAPLAIGLVWQWFFQPTGGVINVLLGTHLAWLNDPIWAMPSVVFVNAWSHVGYVSLFFLAGFAIIPDAIVEAARLDGASARQIFFRIRLPLVRPTTFLWSSRRGFRRFNNLTRSTR